MSTKTFTHLWFQVVFHKMSPNETLFLESTNKIYKDDISSSSFVNFQIWDFPGQVDFFDPTFDYEMIFRGTGALIFVIDAQVKNSKKKKKKSTVWNAEIQLILSVRTIGETNWFLLFLGYSIEA